MSTDPQPECELLEMAAKAFGYVLQWKPSALSHDRLVPKVYDGDGWMTIWNPLEDDSDALQLAVKLHMTVRCYQGTTCAQIGVPGQTNAYEQVADLVDPLAGTRLAIVRAAAVVGRAMP